MSPNFIKDLQEVGSLLRRVVGPLQEAIEVVDALAASRLLAASSKIQSSREGARYLREDEGSYLAFS